MRVESSGVIKKGFCSVCLEDKTVVIIIDENNNNLEVCCPCYNKHLKEGLWDNGYSYYYQKQTKLAKENNEGIVRYL